MKVIRTAGDLARLLDTQLDPVLHNILTCHQGRLALYPDFTFEELALIIIVEAGDRLGPESPVQVRGGCFTQPAEFIHDKTGWYDSAFILSDDGFGLVLIVQQGEGADRDLIAACEAELT